MLSPYDILCISRLEDALYEPSEADDSDEYDNDMWLRADDEAEEQYCERRLNNA